MTEIDLENLKPGMTVAKDVVDKRGRTLVKAGVQLTDKHLKTFKIWRIEKVGIESRKDVDVPEPKIDIEKKREAMKLINPRFSVTDKEHPLIRHLYNYCLTRAVSGREPE